MPGPTPEYLGNPDTDRAVSLIDTAIQQGQGGAQIVEMLDASGLRLYPSPEVGQDEVPPTEGLPPEEMMEQPPVTGEELPPPDMGGLPPEMMGAQEPRGGDDGGMREMRLAAVRFALDKEKKKSSQKEAEK